MYIDQETAGENNFQSMGLRLGNNVTTLPKGTYTICVGGDSMTEIKETTLTVAEKTDDEYTTVTFYYGDANNDESVNATDATVILNAQAGATNKPGKALYALGTKLAFDDETVFYYGDANNDESVNATDATVILNAQAGATNKPGKALYALGTKLENVKIKVVTK